ncbi:uncharacterized protein B0H18DRAFT_880753 [Fomitopsis serialis]|uniref:uncharacterized protein n=1 Tax=Fomitopsis serialis TaxID=139415 RepID=UPI00200785BC|nr:uncharacterized protein B0H18DRAFT_880753 [Neoantrodia serialis]KAH9920744.1 hypothetical protein B0H18DRAFT_880753 [Neoantrodia serialis]
MFQVFFVVVCPFHKGIRSVVQVAFPEEYLLYEKAFQAGVWEPAHPGPWLGRAVVWKLQVGPHRDGLDAGPACIFNCGHYTGGEAILIDLEAKLRYAKPGDVIIFFAGAVYHAVAPWLPAPVLDLRLQKAHITAGRVSHVLFSPHATVQRLHDKPYLWWKLTCDGKYPYIPPKQT